MSATPMTFSDERARTEIGHAAVSLAACHIEHIQTRHERTREKVAMVVLDLDLAADGCGETLTRKGLGMRRRFAAKNLAHG